MAVLASFLRPSIVVIEGSEGRSLDGPAANGSLILVLPFPQIVDDIANELDGLANGENHETKSVQPEE